MMKFQIKTFRKFSNFLIRNYIKSREHPSKQRVIRWIRILSNNLRIISSTKFGFVMALDIDDLVQRTIFYSKEWEPYLSDYFVNNIRIDDVYYDIGCNVGYYSLLASTKGCEVFSFDPDPNNISVLNKNIGLNNFAKNKTFQFGLGQENETKTFYRANVSNNGISGFNKIKAIAEIQSNIFTLDYLIYEKNFRKPTVIKIDTEGWEEKILLGASKLLSTNPPRIIVFESEELGKNSLNEFKSIQQYLIKNNYNVVSTLNDAYGVNHVAIYSPW